MLTEIGSRKDVDFTVVTDLDLLAEENNATDLKTLLLCVEIPKPTTPRKSMHNFKSVVST